MSEDTRTPQLSFDVHPHVQVGDDDLLMVGTTKVKGSFRVPRNLHAGEEFTVTVADADGQVIAQSKAEAQQPAFKDIKDKGIIIGTERKHVLELTEE